jgi:phosphoribosylformimino-5-aminoimidazole carboxamide ribotide isomerase
VNGAAVEGILAATDVPAQLGGGIRDMATIETWLEKGIARVILGTVAVENPGLVRDAARAFPGKVAVGLDARGGFVATKGWAEQTDIAVTDLARAFEDAGVAAIIYTDIDRDGAMQGPTSPRPRRWRGPRRFRSSPRAASPRWPISSRCATPA